MIEDRILDLTNQARGGRRAFLGEAGLRTAARLHSADMQAKDYFDHVDPQGDGPTERVALAHRRLIGLVGENIWKGDGLNISHPDEVAKKIVDAWLRSPGHRANIESERFTHLGVGVTVAGAAVFATQNFAYIHALTEQDVPLNVQSGTPVSMSVNGVRGQSAARFDTFDLSRGLAVDGPAELATSRWRAAPGRYLVRFYFSSGTSHYVIYNGPMVRIQ